MLHRIIKVYCFLSLATHIDEKWKWQSLTRPETRILRRLAVIWPRAYMT